MTMILAVVMKGLVLVWWRPMKMEHHFYKQGIKGPPYRLFIGNDKELVAASPDFSHNIFPRVLSLEGEIYAYHRKIVTQTFHMDHLMVRKSVTYMLEKWWGEMSDSGEIEIEVSDWFQMVIENVITRPAFGASYDHDLNIFRLQARQMLLAA